MSQSHIPGNNAEVLEITTEYNFTYRACLKSNFLPEYSYFSPHQPWCNFLYYHHSDPRGPVAPPGSTLAPPETQVDEEELCAAEENAEESTSAAAEATTP